MPNHDSLAFSRRSFLLSGSVAGLAVRADAAPDGSGPAVPRCLWLSMVKEPDSYVAFRGAFELSEPAEVTLRFLGASWFLLWIDGVFRSEGPARFVQTHPEFQMMQVRLPAGRHVIAVQVHSEGISTRLLENIAPFWMAKVSVASREIPVRWRALALDGHKSRMRRISPQLGWVEWSDTRKLPVGWRSPEFDDASWKEPLVVNPDLGAWAPVGIAEVQTFVHGMAPIAKGRLVEQFAYANDDPSVSFFLRDLNDDKLPAQGVWRRYDLGRVRLGRAHLTLDLPEGAVVEIAYSEALQNGRVSPWITLSLGPTCNLDHFVAQGGEQEFFPHTPKGGRFVEVHVLAAPDRVRFVREEYLERTYHGTPEGSLHTLDPLLDRIWMTGVETYRACAEDAVIDNPTRERGQWVGDVATVGMEIASVSYRDLRLFRRGLVQCARCARPDGMVAGLCPGGRSYLSTYAAQWATACLRYWELSGDKSVLSELWLAAERNAKAFTDRLTPDGVADNFGWGFVDWGYVRNSGPSDMGVNIHWYAALEDMARWSDVLGNPARSAYYASLAGRMKDLLSNWYAKALQSTERWKAIGLHRAVLGLRLGLFVGDGEREAVAMIKSHISNCFPLDTEAPRLSGPAAANPRLFTPYFGHYALRELILRGEMDFVLDVYRKAWGWALEGGRTTWVEVFDPRWTHCHQWSGCPTWQLSRFLLGLNARFDLGASHYAFLLRPGSLPAAQGRLPVPGAAGAIEISWSREGQNLRYRLETPVPLVLHPTPGQPCGIDRPVAVDHVFERMFTARQLSGVV